MTAGHILIVEDEAKIAALLRDYLELDGFRTHWLANGSDVQQYVMTERPDLVLLDLMLPGKDGVNVCRELRDASQVPIIMLTARVEEVDRLIGLGAGADDYVCKPFSPREVVARVHAVLRRIREPYASSDAYRGLRLQKSGQSVTKGDQTLTLTGVEFRLLETLLEEPGKIFSRNQLIERAYTDGRIVSDRTIDTHVKNLRRKLEQLDEDDLIHSIYGAGYRLE